MAWHSIGTARSRVSIGNVYSNYYFEAVLQIQLLLAKAGRHCTACCAGGPEAVAVIIVKYWPGSFGVVIVDRGNAVERVTVAVAGCSCLTVRGVALVHSKYLS